MRFQETTLSGVYLIHLDFERDERGFFARTFSEELFAERGLATHYVQSSISFNEHRSILRGLHYQTAPKLESKLVRCTRGAIYDVILDLRKDSVSYGKWEAFELTAENRLTLYVPKGCAHGFQTLEADTEILYHMDEFYVQELARGVRWNDPQFKIQWPLQNPILSEKDRNLPDFRP